MPRQLQSGTYLVALADGVGDTTATAAERVCEYDGFGFVDAVAVGVWLGVVDVHAPKADWQP